MDIIVSFCPVNYDNARRRIAQQNAIFALTFAPNNVKPIALGLSSDWVPPNLDNSKIKMYKNLKRDSYIEIGNDRHLPYIKEIMDFCSSFPCNVFGYINSDIIIGEDSIRYLSENHDAYIFSRYEIAELTVSDKDFIKDSKTIFGGDKHEGADGFFFNKEWWVKNRDLFPDNLIVGETEWDTVYRFIIKKHSTNYIEKRTLRHVFHSQAWNTTSPGAKNNIEIWNKVMEGK